MFEAIAKIYTQHKKFPLALAYNDSSLVATNRAIATGHEKHETIGEYYRLRGKIYQEMGLIDSALVNMQKGFRIDLGVGNGAFHIVHF